MYDDNDEFTCQICLEFYEPNKKVPKRLECCNQVYCLQCLEDIYRKHKDHIQCPICRLNIKKSPKDLKVVKEYLQIKSKVTCPSCFRSIKSTQLKLAIFDSNPNIFCNQCCTSSGVECLDIYLLNLLDEMSYFQTAFCNIDTKAISKEIDKITQTCVDNILNRLKSGLYDRVKSRLDDIIQNKILTVGIEDLTSKVNQLNTIICDLRSVKEVKNSDYPHIIGSIDFYIRNSEILKENSIALNKLVQSAQIFNDFITLDEKVNYSELEDFMERLLVVKVKNNSFKICENDDGKTGIHFIDSKINVINFKDIENVLLDINRASSYDESPGKVWSTPFDDDY
jgi:hypothetical protein